MDRTSRTWRRLAARYGMSYEEPAGRGHPRIRDAAGRIVAVVSRSATSDHHALRNTEARLRRASKGEQ